MHILIDIYAEKVIRGGYTCKYSRTET